MKKQTIIISLILLSLGIYFISVISGGSGIPVSDSIHGLLNPGSEDMASSIVWKIRLPRIILALIIGIGLASSGCVMQSIIRNPLADPYTLGVSGGAAFGASLSILLGLTNINIFFLPVFSFLGTLSTTLIIYALASLRNFSRSTLILTGVILSFFFSSLVLLIFSVADPQKLHSTIIWLMGDLSSSNPLLTKIAAFIVIPGTIVIFFFSRELDLLTLGDEKAFQLGLNTKLAKQILFLTSSVIIGVCVSVSGIIGFVGLVIPHIARTFTGSRHYLLIPSAAILGSAFLVFSDTIARTIVSPVELPVGVITGIIGGGFILIFLIKGSKNRIF